MQTHSINKRPFARFLRWLTTLMGLYFAITAILAITIDPWRINDTIFQINAVDASREISGTVRVGKAALANRSDWDIAILGSSRMEIAFDPAHPVFDGKKTVNLAMSAANVMENVPAGHYLLDRNTNLKTLIFGIEAGDLHSKYDSRPITRFYQSPFADDNRSIERLIDQIIGGNTFLDSVATIRRHLNNEPPIRNPLGLWLEPTNPGNLRNYVETSFRLRQDILDAAWDSEPGHLRQDKVELLTNFIDRVRDSGIRMIVVIPPQHALRQIHPTENLPSAMLWERDLMLLVDVCQKANTRTSDGPLVELWSFLTFNEYTMRAMPGPDAENRRMAGWFDLGHCHTDLGDLALQLMFKGEADANQSIGPVGINMLENRWDTIRETWIRDHERYCELRKDDVAWWRNLVNQAMNERNSTDFN